MSEILITEEQKQAWSAMVARQREILWEIQRANRGATAPKIQDIYRALVLTAKADPRMHSEHAEVVKERKSQAKQLAEKEP